MAILNDNNETSNLIDLAPLCITKHSKFSIFKELIKYFNEFEDEIKANIKNRLRVSKRIIIILKELNPKYIDRRYKFYLMNISRRNKNDMNEYVHK